MKNKKIKPITELRNTNEISSLCHESDEPIIITKNGYGDMVLMSIETYEENLNRNRIYRELEISERQVEAGKVMDAQESLTKLRDKYGL